MDIGFAFDEGYADHAQVAMESILDCHAARSDLTFWLLTTAQVANDRAGALRRQTDGRAGVEFLTTDDRFRSMPDSQRDQCRYISTGMYLRLFLPDLLPSRVRRLLYLDSDVLVNGDLAPLWELPLGVFPVAAVRDGLARSMGYEGGIPGAGPQIRASAPYFNSGVLVMNVPVWRQLRVTERCLDYLSQHRQQLRFPDQDALNLVCYDQWLRLKSIWNDTVLWWLKADDYAAVCQSVRITHFLGPNKPWQREFPFAAYRERYCELASRVPGLRGAEPAAAASDHLGTPESDPSTMDQDRTHSLGRLVRWTATTSRAGLDRTGT